MSSFCLSTVVVFHFIHATIGAQFSSCNFTSRATLDPKAVLLLSAVAGQIFETNDPDFRYVVAICAPIPSMPSAGAVQTKVLSGGTVQSLVLGRETEAELRYSDEWIMLTYFNGDAYSNACGGQPRQTTIMIMCDPSSPFGNLRFMHEEARVNKTVDCSYLFELDHAALCSAEVVGGCAASLLIAGMSVGTVLIIIFFSLVAVYCLCGVTYRRFIVGANGIQLLPNFEFWRDFGELQADGCDYIFRAGNMAYVPLSIPVQEAREPASYASGRTTSSSFIPAQTATAVATARSSAVSKPQ